MERLELRELLLGATFQPKQEDIPTPQLLLDKGVQPDALRLVGMNGVEAVALNAAAGDDTVLRTALYICHALRWRDGESTPVLAMTDAKELTTKDVDLLNELGLVVKPFLGLMPKAVEAAKNDSPATPSDEPGSPSPQPSEASPSQNSNGA